MSVNKLCSVSCGRLQSCVREKSCKKVEKKFAIAIKSATFASPFEKRASLRGREFIEKVAIRHSVSVPLLRGWKKTSKKLQKSFGSSGKSATFAAPFEKRESFLSERRVLWSVLPISSCFFRFGSCSKKVKKVLEIKKKGLPLHSHSKGWRWEVHWEDWMKYKKASTENKIKTRSVDSCPRDAGQKLRASGSG